jgi:hypothetical protein
MEKEEKEEAAKKVLLQISLSDLHAAKDLNWDNTIDSKK